jgi:hypothetical protein
MKRMITGITRDFGIYILISEFSVGEIGRNKNLSSERKYCFIKKISND